MTAGRTETIDLLDSTEASSNFELLFRRRYTNEENRKPRHKSTINKSNFLCDRPETADVATQHDALSWCCSVRHLQTQRVDVPGLLGAERILHVLQRHRAARLHALVELPVATSAGRR